MRCRATIAATTCVLTLTLISNADDAPFVSGFDRFFQSEQPGDLTGGRLLLRELSCTACHPTADPQLKSKGGPSLVAAGLRLQSEWLQRFLNDPHGVKHGTTMPNVLHGQSDDERAVTIRALVAFLSTQRTPFPVLKSTAGNPIAPEFWNKGDVARGETLYHQVGCVACHEASPDYDVPAVPPSRLDQLLKQLDPEELRELGLADAARPVNSVPHGDLVAKYTRKSLTHFLLDPHRARPAARMPSLKLTPDEAASIAAWLLREQKPNPGPVPLEADGSLIAKGRELFKQLRCVNCHQVAEKLNPIPARPLDQLDLDAQQRCIAPSPERLPDYSMNDPQRMALRRAIIMLHESRDDPLPPDAQATLDFELLTFNCYACHERDNRGGVGPKRRAYFETVRHIDLGDEGRIPPLLDGVGQKLKRDWLKKVLTGTGDIRPHLRTRMPVFSHSSATGLVPLLIAADRTSKAVPSEREVFGEIKGLAEHGRSLMDTGCVQCHPMRGERLPGVLGTDLAGIEQRLEPDWFREFLHNPIALRKRTRMPSFFPGGRSSRPDVLDGNVDRQIAAMWAYLRDINRQKLPQKILLGKEHNFELVPKDRPIVLRTFMREAGTHAIAVGFPQKLSLAFDSREIRLAQLWKGRFLDAHGTWYDRFTPLAMPLGTDIVTLPSGVPFAVLRDRNAAWPAASADTPSYEFRGYRLSRAGVPTLLYQFGKLTVSDRCDPDKEGGLIRVFRFDGDPLEQTLDNVWFRVLTGNSIRRKRDGSLENEKGLKITVKVDNGNQVTVRQSDGQSEAIVLIGDVGGLLKTINRNRREIEVRYKW